MAMKFMTAMKKMEKFGNAIGDANAARNSKGDFTKRVASRKAKKKFMKMFK